MEREGDEGVGGDEDVWLVDKLIGRDIEREVEVIASE